jgi:hypothetical protein
MSELTWRQAIAWEGVWSFACKANRIEVRIEPSVKPSARVQGAAEEEAERIAAYREKPLELRWPA